MFWHAVFQVGRKEFLQHFRTKRLFVVGTLLAVTMVLATVVAPKVFYEEERANEPDTAFDEFGNPVDYEPDYSDYEPNQVLVIYLAAPIIGGYMFVQLVAIILTSDSVCSEWQNRTIFLLLSKPVPRSAFLIGKYAGTVGALSAVVLAVLLGDYIAMNLLLPEGREADALAFLGAAAILILGAAGFAAFSLFTSTITRSTIMSTLAGLGAWLFIFPVIGSVGFIVAMTDEDFRTEGEYDWEAVFNECGGNPYYERGGPAAGPDADAEAVAADEERAERQAEYDACVAPFETEFRMYYLDRGLEEWFDYDTEQQRCQELSQEYHDSLEPLGPNATHEDYEEREKSNPGGPCYAALHEKSREFELERTRILREKYDSPRVDWSRYLSPSSTMTVADDVLLNGREVNPYNEIGLSPETVFAGADSTPSNRAAAIVALFAFAAVFIGLALAVVKRRDFE